MASVRGYFMLLTILIIFASSPNQSADINLPNVPLPAQYRNGYLLSTGPQDGPTMDVYLGPFCEDSKRMYPIMESLAQEQSGSVTIRLHMFPLPYNIGSFLAGQSCVAARILKNNTDAAVECLSLLYKGDNQRNLKTEALSNATTPMQIQSLIDLLAVPLGVDPDEMAQQMRQGTESGAESYDMAKADWKYGCSLGVIATPAVFINGVQIYGYDASFPGTHSEGDLASLSVEDWNKVLMC